MLSRTKLSCLKRKRKRWEEVGSVWNLLLLYDAYKINYLKDISARGRAYGPSFADQAMETEHNTTQRSQISVEKKKLDGFCFVLCLLLTLLYFQHLFLSAFQTDGDKWSTGAEVYDWLQMISVSPLLICKHF